MPVGAGWKALVALGALLWAAGVVAAGLGFAERAGWLGVPDVAARVGAAVATWVAILVLTRRCGGQLLLVGLFAATLLGCAVAFPENWALAGAAVVTAMTYGLLGALLTRPAPGLRAAREVLIAVGIGLIGAVVLGGYDVELRMLRFRVLVMSAVLIAGFVLAWRLGLGAGSLGRRGLLLILIGTVLIGLSVIYTRAVNEWGSPDIVQGINDAELWLSEHAGAVPRPIEALVAFPILLWGVATRARRRQGWWMCAFGALGVTAVATAFLQVGSDPLPTLLATGYDVVIGVALGLVLITADRLLTGGGGRRAASAADVELQRPEPPRFAPLL